MKILEIIKIEWKWAFMNKGQKMEFLHQKYPSGGSYFTNIVYNSLPKRLKRMFKNFSSEEILELLSIPILGSTTAFSSILLTTQENSVRVILDKLNDYDLFRCLNLIEDASYNYISFLNLTSSHILITKSAPALVDYILTRNNKEQRDHIMNLKGKTEISVGKLANERASKDSDFAKVLSKYFPLIYLN